MPYDWNIDWTTVPAEDLLSSEVFDLFSAAIYERSLLALSWLVLPGDEEFGDPVYPNPYQWFNVRALRSSGCRDLSLNADFFWVKSDENYEGAVAIQGTHKIIDNLVLTRTINGVFPWGYISFTGGDTFSSWRGFPTAGTKRKFPREIYDLTNPGEDGEVARLTACIHRTWRGVASTESGFGTTVNTPTDLYEKSGQHFLRRGGEWVQTDQSPDIREEVIPGNYIQLINPAISGRSPFTNFLGDYFGGHWLNDTRDMLNQSTRACVRVRRKAKFLDLPDVYETGIDGLAVVRDATPGADQWLIQIDIANPQARTWNIEFWVKPLDGNPVFVSISESYEAYTVWQRLGEMTITSSGRYTHPIPGSIEVNTNSEPYAGTLLNPQVAIIIRGDVAGGLVYR